MIKYEKRAINGELRYVSLEDYTYFSKRFNKSITITKEFISDGATGAKDINSMSWWIHDALSEWEHWDDGSFCSIYDSSLVIYDVLKSEDRYIRAPLWFIGTFVGRHILSIFS